MWCQYTPRGFLSFYQVTLEHNLNKIEKNFKFFENKNTTIKFSRPSVKLILPLKKPQPVESERQRMDSNFSSGQFFNIDSHVVDDQFSVSIWTQAKLTWLDRAKFRTTVLKLFKLEGLQHFSGSKILYGPARIPCSNDLSWETWDIFHSSKTLCWVDRSRRTNRIWFSLISVKISVGPRMAK